MSDCDVEIIGRDSDEHSASVAQELESAQHSLQQTKERHCLCGCEDFSTGDSCCNSREDDCFLSC
jgi:hypothetical protein